MFQSVFYELYKIKPYITHPNFHLLLMLIDLEEYRFLNGYSKDRKKGSTRSDRIPTALYASETIMSVDDYKKLIPDELDDTFTAKDFAKACHVNMTIAQPAVNVLTHVGALKHIGKRGQAYLYQRCAKIICRRRPYLSDSADTKTAMVRAASLMRFLPASYITPVSSELNAQLQFFPAISITANSCGSVCML